MASLAMVNADDHVYDHYYGYNDISGYSDYYNAGGYYNGSTAASPYKRVFNAPSTASPFKFTASFSLKIPISELSTSLTMSVPFSFEFPSTASSSGRSFGGHERGDVYTALEKYISSSAGVNGHACLLRAICEVSLAPKHNDGLVGDAVNMLLSTGTTLASITKEDETIREYVEAQDHAQNTGTCNSYHKECPMSFFNLVLPRL